MLRVMAEWQALLLRRSSGDTDELKSRDLLRRFLEQCGRFLGAVRDAGVVVFILGFHRCSRRRRLSHANAM
jgi:hypothetical protein